MSSVSYADLTAATARKFMSEVDYESLKRTIVLDVYFERLQYSVVRHFPSMTADTFIANIGMYNVHALFGVSCRPFQFPMCAHLIG